MTGPKPPTGRHRVMAHTRVGPDGRTHRVRTHGRTRARGLNTIRARRNLMTALRAWRRRNRGKAAALMALAGMEVGALLTVRGTALVVASVGLLLVGAAVTLKQAAPEPPASPRAAPPRSPGMTRSERERRRQQRLRSEQLEQQQQEEQRQAAALEAYHRMREARQAQPARPAPGHPGGHWPTTRAEWEGAPDDHPHKAAAMDFYQQRGPRYTGPVEWTPGTLRPTSERDRRRQLEDDDRERQTRWAGPAWPDHDADDTD